MKAIGILWNSMDGYSNDAICDIKNYAVINDILSINFEDNFPKFISIIYPYMGKEIWKLEYKISHMHNKYISNKIRILFLDINAGEKKYLERKNIYIYENVEGLKSFIRNKYRNLVLNYAFDNVFHMTDDEIEYERTINAIIDYILSNYSEQKKCIDLDSLLLDNRKKLDKSKKFGKRSKVSLCDNKLIYKEEKEGTYESYSELFCFKLLNKLNISVAEYYLSKYLGKRGVITKNFINDDEIFIDGTHLIDVCLTFLETGIIEFDNKTYHDLETITKYNNFDDLFSIFEIISKKTGVDLNDVLSDLKKVYAIDLLLLQSDRNSNNWGILYNKESKCVKLAPIYDNSNIFGFSNPDKIERMKKSLESEETFYSILYDESITLLNLHRNTNYFISKISIINDLDDKEILDYLKEYVETIENIGVENLVDKIIHEMPEQNYEKFKEIILKSLTLNIKYIKGNLKEKIKKFIK